MNYNVFLLRLGLDPSFTNRMNEPIKTGMVGSIDQKVRDISVHTAIMINFISMTTIPSKSREHVSLKGSITVKRPTFLQLRGDLK